MWLVHYKFHYLLIFNHLFSAHIFHAHVCGHLTKCTMFCRDEHGAFLSAIDKIQQFLYSRDSDEVKSIVWPCFVPTDTQANRTRSHEFQINKTHVFDTYVQTISIAYSAADGKRTFLLAYRCLFE